MFNDTTRLRMMSRPALNEAFSRSSAKLGRRGISQSFKDKIVSPVRPTEPPPPPPDSKPSHTRKFIQFGAPETRRIVMKRSSSTPASAKCIYDIAEHEEVPKNFHSLQRVKQRKKERSHSFTPKSHLFSRLAKSISSSSLEEEESKKALSSSDLVTILPSTEDQRLTFKDIRKILSSPSISSNSSSAASIAKDEAKSSEHIYEEIPDRKQSRPLPPLPVESKKKTSGASTITITSEDNAVKSIFEGATKYDILHYLEDAKERGLTDVELDVDTDDCQLVQRNHANRVSNISSSSSSSGSAILLSAKDRCWNTVDIERNDSGLGSETGKMGKRPIRIRDKDRQEHICEDCDQAFEEAEADGSVCLSCAKRRCERKEIITEIIETEIKYGRDLRIIQEEFYRPMQVAGLLSPDLLSSIFLNVEELADVNMTFTEALKDAIEIALDEGDEDMCSVKIGKLFVEADPMLGAFKSYCTRQVCF